MPAQRPRKRTTKSRKTSGGGGFGLPGFRFLIPAAVIAGGWMVAQDMGLDMRLFDQAEKQKRPQAAVSAPERGEAKAKAAAPRQAAREVAVVPAARPQVDVAENRSAKAPTAVARARSETPPPRTPAETVTPAFRPPVEVARLEPRETAKPLPPAARPAQPALPAGKLLFVSVDANLRMQASGSSEVIAILPRGAAVKLLASRDEWRLVSTSRRLGWVHRDQLEESTASIRRPAAATDMEPRIAGR